MNGTNGTSGSSGTNAGITTYNNPGNNRVITSENATTINSESNLTFDGSVLYANGSVGINTNSPYAKLEVVGASQSATDRSTHFELSTGDGSVGSEKLIFGILDNNYSWLQSVKAGTSYKPLMINPNGGNVGIGTTSSSYQLQVVGSFAATTKSFVIDHPTKTDYYLRYGSLEGPENGVYLRGKLIGVDFIDLPDYWVKLVNEESITVNITPIGIYQTLYVIEIKDNKIYIGGCDIKYIKFYYTVFAERKDVDKLEIEIKKN